MTLGTHAVVGAAVASFFPGRPVTAFILGFASHFLIDAIPHRDYDLTSGSIDPKIASRIKIDWAFLRDSIVISSDALIGLLVVLLFLGIHGDISVILVGAIAGILPDPLQFIYSRFPRGPLTPLQRFHMWIHTNSRMENSPVLGIITQALFVCLIIIVATYFLDIAER